MTSPSRVAFVASDAQTIFDHAINSGVFSLNEASDRCALNWMYMYHSDDHTAHFKNKWTKEYLSVHLPAAAQEGEPL